MSMSFWQQLLALFRGRETAESEAWPTDAELIAGEAALDRSIAAAVQRGGPAWSESNLRLWWQSLPSLAWAEEWEEMLAAGDDPLAAAQELAGAYLRSPR